MPDALRGMKVKERAEYLHKLTKKQVFDIFQRYNRLDVSHAVSEPKDTLVSQVLYDEFGKNYYADLETYRDSLKKTLSHVRRLKK